MSLVRVKLDFVVDVDSGLGGFMHPLSILDMIEFGISRVASVNAILPGADLSLSLVKPKRRGRAK